MMRRYNRFHQSMIMAVQNHICGKYSWTFDIVNGFLWPWSVRKMTPALVLTYSHASLVQTVKYNCVYPCTWLCVLPAEILVFNYAYISHSIYHIYNDTTLAIKYSTKIIRILWRMPVARFDICRKPEKEIDKIKWQINLEILCFLFHFNNK